MTTTLPSKLGIKPNQRAILVSAPSDIRDTLATSGARFVKSLTGSFEYMQAFFNSQARLDARFSALKAHLAPGGSLWISWPKRRQLDSDLNLKTIIGIGYRHGLVESKTIGLDDTWSAIKFTFPKKGKVYQNSYGTLPSDTGHELSDPPKNPARQRKTKA